MGHAAAQVRGACEIRSDSDAFWHALPGDEVLAQVKGDAGGLSAGEAEARLKTHGPNRLPRAPMAPWWRVVGRQFVSPLILVLGVAAGISLAIGDVPDAGFIAAVLVLNGFIGGIQEWRAERSAQSLQRLLQFRASVERDGEVQEIDAAEVVPGDIVWLESGFRVPADARLLSVNGLKIDESLLTGESLSVTKDAAWIGPPETPLADQLNMVFAGTTVVHGRGKAVVTATGLESSVGRLAIDVLGVPPGRPPLLVRLDRFSRGIGAASVVAAVLTVVLGVLVHGRGVAEMAIFGVALAVSVIPEGLPIAITIALAVASTRMARRGVIVRRLGAVEGLGSCTLIASDKTGTLTCNELTVREVRLMDGGRFSVSGEGFLPRGDVRRADGPASAGEPIKDLARIAVLCNEGDLHEHDGQWIWRGDPTDIALLTFAHKLGMTRERELDAHAEVCRIPFEPERLFSAAFHRFGPEVRVMVKGAPERVLAMCADGVDDVRRRARSTAEQMAASGLRVLALAEGGVPEAVDPAAAPPQPRGLKLVGLVGMIDPLRSGAREAIEVCERAGIGVCMVTGDHPRTALAIARELGIASAAEQVVTGEQFERLADEQVRAAMAGGPETAGRVRVFARVAPDQKLRIVKAARTAGHFVAVTGDGANDAPALRAANIGVAMGRGGTDIARDASDLVISDDNFATIVAGVAEGRIAYDNIRKVIYLLTSTNGAEVIMAVAAVAVGLPLPLLPVQLLWLNLVTEGMQHVALAFEPGEDDVKARPPRRPTEPVFNRLMIERLLVGSLVMGCVSLGAFWWMLEQGWEVAEARNLLLLLMVLFENVQIGNCRSEMRSGFSLSPLRNPLLLLAALGSVGMHVAAMQWGPLQRLLSTGPVGTQGWAVLAGMALSVFVAMEIYKLAKRRGQRPVRV